MKTPLQQAFELFLGYKELANDFSIPFQFDKFTYATDRHVAIRISTDKVDFEIPEYTLTKPDIGRVGWEFKNLRPFIADRAKIESFMTVDEKIQINLEEECGECDGFGQVEWTYKRHTMGADCPVCDGAGVSVPAKFEKTGNKTFEEYTFMVINDYGFNPSFIYKLFKVKDLLGEEIQIADFAGNMGKFKIGDCEIIIIKVIDPDPTIYTVQS